MKASNYWQNDGASWPRKFCTGIICEYASTSSLEQSMNYQRKKRFRGRVKIFEPLQGNVNSFVTLNNDSWMLPTLDYSLLWVGMKGDKKMEVEETPIVEYLAENPGLDKKEILQELHENSTLLRTITKSLYIRELAGESATRQLTNIGKVGFDHSKITGLFKEHVRRIRKISTQLENDSDI